MWFGWFRITPANIRRSAAVTSIAAQIGCTPHTLHIWVKKVEIDIGQRAGVPTDMAEKLKALERESSDLQGLADRPLDYHAQSPSGAIRPSCRRRAGRMPA